MSEFILPDFMQDLLDKTDSGNAHEGMYELGRRYQKELQRIKDTLGAYGPNKDVSKIYQQRTSDLRNRYEESARVHAIEHGYKEEVQEKETLSRNEKLAKAKENFDLEPDPDKPRIATPSPEKKEQSKNLTNLVVNTQDITSKDQALVNERAQFLAEMKAAEERNKTNERER